MLVTYIGTMPWSLVVVNSSHFFVLYIFQVLVINHAFMSSHGRLRHARIFKNIVNIILMLNNTCQQTLTQFLIMRNTLQIFTINVLLSLIAKI
jgi:hypothetical protein